MSQTGNLSVQVLAVAVLTAASACLTALVADRLGRQNYLLRDNQRKITESFVANSRIKTRNVQIADMRRDVQDLEQKYSALLREKEDLLDELPGR